MLDETVAGRRFNTLLVTIFAVAASCWRRWNLRAACVHHRATTPRDRHTHRLGAPQRHPAGGRRTCDRRCLRGGVAGVVLSVAVSAIAGLLFGIAPLDAVSYTTAACVLAGVVATAAAFPLRRALNVDPAVSLRAE
jgi:hypothetical protein